MSSITAASLPLPTTACSPKKGQFPSGSQHPDYKHALDPHLVGKTFGWVTIISPEIIRQKKRIYVWTRCSGCSQEKWILLDNLRYGKSLGCQRCSQPHDPRDAVLGRRYDAIISRCGNPASRHWDRYGGRGIQCKFASRREFVLWVRENLPHKDYRGAEIDRVDNNGHYEPGNLRLASRSQQLRNTSRNVWTTWKGEPILAVDLPQVFATSRMVGYAGRGFTGEQIIARAWQSVKEKRKNWRGILEKLQSMTS